MISNWTARNFKAISEASINLGKLNVILGRNSVGKSSLIQSIISSSQYFATQYPSSKYSFIGNAQDLGPANLVQNRNSPNQPLEIQFQFSKSLQNYDGQLLVSPELPEKQSDEMVISRLAFTGSSSNSVRGGQLECRLETTAKGKQVRVYFFHSDKPVMFLSLGKSEVADDAFRDNILPSRQNNSDSTYHSPAWLETHLLRLVKYFGPNARLRRDLEFRPRFDTGSPSEIAMLGEFLRSVVRVKNAKNPLAAAWASVPQAIKSTSKHVGIHAALQAILTHRQEVEKNEAALKKYERALKRDSPGSRKIPPRPIETSVSPQLIWFGLVYLLAMSDAGKIKNHPEFEYLFSDVKLSGESTLDRFFASLMMQASLKLTRRVKYLGPMRAVHPSEQRNGRSPSPIIPIGRGGEYLSHFLHTNHSLKRTFCLPTGTKETSLGKALDSWLSFFEIGKTSSTRSSAWGASEYLLDGERTNQKGTGVSQILPVILLALISEPGDLLIVEQPELHLHPAHQRKLADLLVAFANHGVQVISETHSEHLVTRLRVLVATGKIASEQAKVIFAEKKGARNKSQVRFRVAEIDKLGQVDYWPEGFFEESLGDRLLLSSIQFAAQE